MTKHREVLAPKNQFAMGYVGSNSSGVHVGNEEGGNVTWEDNLSRYQRMIFDVASQDFGMYFEPSKEVPNPNIERFYNLLEAINRTLSEEYVHS